MYRHQIYLRRLNPDGATLASVDALEVDDRAFRQFVIDMLVEGGVRATPEQLEGTIAAVVVGDRDAGDLVGEVTVPSSGAAPAATANTTSANTTTSTTETPNEPATTPPTEPTPPATS